MIKMKITFYENHNDIRPCIGLTMRADLTPFYKLANLSPLIIPVSRFHIEIKKRNKSRKHLEKIQKKLEKLGIRANILGPYKKSEQRKIKNGKYHTYCYIHYIVYATTDRNNENEAKQLVLNIKNKIKDVCCVSFHKEKYKRRFQNRFNKIQDIDRLAPFCDKFSQEQYKRWKNRFSVKLKDGELKNKAIE